MDKHIEKAMQLRSNAMCPNCAETIMMTYAEELGLSESQMKALGTNFGGGMKSGSTCDRSAYGTRSIGNLRSSYRRRVPEKNEREP